ncbi:unnamed protein product [Lactuca saligna]|uniref:Uncharacterized protein n=1 Tax=Lactuca saligna TaxID=75948 RepID=A0AA35YTB7_LACSI|nr:unnamed protein product [Lactuca saligna]
MLNIKLKQNLILDLESSRYNEDLGPMIECLRFSSLAQALTMAESVPLVHLSKAYLSANYSKYDGLIQFEDSWNGLFTLLFKSFFKRVVGSEIAIAPKHNLHHPPH